MRAARLHAFDQPLVVEEVPAPAEPGPGQVLVRVAASGLCHSDLHVISGRLKLVPSLPWILGHENAGWVEACGPGVQGWQPGEPVAVFGGWGCGACRFCLGGDEQLCDLMRWCGHGHPGGYAEYLTVPAPRHLVRLGDLDPVEAAPLTDAGLTAFRAVRRALPRLRPDGLAVLIGLGGLGHYALQLLRLRSPATVVVVETSPARRALAGELGADGALDPAAVDAVAEVRALTRGQGADVVLDFVGADATLALAAGAVGRAGQVVLVGLAGGSVPWSFKGVASEATLTTSNWGNRNELEEVIGLARRGLVRGRIERHPLDTINDVFARLRAGGVTGRAVVLPTAHLPAQASQPATPA